MLLNPGPLAVKICDEYSGYHNVAGSDAGKSDSDHPLARYSTWAPNTMAE